MVWFVVNVSRKSRWEQEHGKRGVAVLHSNMLDGYGLGMDFIRLCLDFGGITSRGT